MKKLLALVAVLGMFTFGTVTAQEGNQNTADPAGGNIQQSDADLASQAAVVVDSAAAAAAEAAADAAESAKKKMEQVAEMVASSELDVEPKKEVKGLHQTVKRYFIEGGAGFMALVLICLIFGLALSIERIIYLNMATTNSEKLLVKIEDALRLGGVNAAKDVCRATRGPVASIFYQGLDRSSGDFDEMAKAIEDYGSVEMSKLEKGLSWISLFIALAPMLGFMGTVIGMISAFDKIAEANTINASIVAGGIKIALITTVSGLIVAIILQVFYNYILSKIDSIVLDMEESTMELVDILYKRKLENN
jgi:biopolymer transport protein ExbB